MKCNGLEKCIGWLQVTHERLNNRYTIGRVIKKRRENCRVTTGAVAAVKVHQEQGNLCGNNVSDSDVAEAQSETVSSLCEDEVKKKEDESKVKNGENEVCTLRARGDIETDGGQVNKSEKNASIEDDTLTSWRRKRKRDDEEEKASD